MDKFKKPEFKIDEYSVEQNHGKFIVEPLERDLERHQEMLYGRVLLSSLPGTAMYAVEIEGIRHEFSAIAGVEEDATSLILNLKAVNYVSESYAMNQESEIKLKVIGPKVVTANDFITPSGIDVINKDAYICTVAEGGSLDATIYVKTGRGYVLAEKNKSNKLPFGTIPTDSNFTPIKKVAFEVEPTRVGHDSNYDRLIIFALKAIASCGVQAPLVVTSIIKRS